MKQQTINKEIRFSGKALQTGQMVDIVCKPAEAEAGIVFKRTDIAEEDVLRLPEDICLESQKRRSTIGVGLGAIQTVEHFLAALWALSIDNMLIEINGAELPALDGSAKGFFEFLNNAGTREQELDRKVIRIQEIERVEENDRSITIAPADTFNVSYLIDYDTACIGQEVFDLDLDQDSFEKEIAPARTFCLKEEAEALLKAGFGQGATFENTLVLDDNGPVGTTLRFPNEPVRHKILDLVGDLYILGRPIMGKVVAEKTGHSMNAKMVQKIYEKYIKG